MATTYLVPQEAPSLWPPLLHFHLLSRPRFFHILTCLLSLPYKTNIPLSLYSPRFYSPIMELPLSLLSYPLLQSHFLFMCVAVSCLSCKLFRYSFLLSLLRNLAVLAFDAPLAVPCLPCVLFCVSYSLKLSSLFLTPPKLS